MRENVLLILFGALNLFLIFFLSFFPSSSSSISLFLLLSSSFLRFLSFTRHNGSSAPQTRSSVSSKTTLVKQGYAITSTSYHRICPRGKEGDERLWERGKRLLTHAVCAFLFLCSSACVAPLPIIVLSSLPPLFPRLFSPSSNCFPLTTSTLYSSSSLSCLLSCHVGCSSIHSFYPFHSLMSPESSGIHVKNHEDFMKQHLLNNFPRWHFANVETFNLMKKLLPERDISLIHKCRLKANNQFPDKDQIDRWQEKMKVLSNKLLCSL